MTRVQQHASRLDSAIDSILRDGPAPVSRDEDRLVATARLLRRSLPRLPPSFAFEAHLAARLAAARRMELDDDKVMMNIHRYGNTTSATLPLCLVDYEKQLKKGDNVVFASFGGGFTWGAIYLKWAYDSN